MARKSVFPFIESGLKVIDNNVVNSLGDEQDTSLGAYNANEDKNVEWFFSSGGNLGVAILYLDKEDQEVLIDFNQTPDDIYSQVSGPSVSNFFQLYFGPVRLKGFSGEIDVDLYLTPGSVFCVAVKNKASDITVRSLVTYYTQPDGSDFEQVFSSSFISLDKNSRADIGVGKWSTFMFDGKRFVLLGSNNWVS